MTHYIKHGNRYQILPNGALDATELLPLGTYKVGYMEPADDYFLEKIDDFAEPVGKVYGDTIKHRDRILNTFRSRDSATGVMLTGEKGSGKTMLAKLLSLLGQETGTPTIVINQPWHGDTFNAFIQSIEQEAIVVFDEFEKTYNNEQQEKLLTLLDGVYSSKKLFILTCNDRLKLNSHMVNRPGRIFYRIDYKGLPAEFIREYCEDTLADKERIDEVVRASMLFARFNFDMLKALVEEMNRYDESAEESLKLLNANPELSENLRYIVQLRVGGKLVPIKHMHNGGEWRGNPLTQEVQVYYRSSGQERNALQEEFVEDFAPYVVEDDAELLPAVFAPGDLLKVDKDTGQFVFRNAAGLEAALAEKVYSHYDYSVVQ